MKKGLYFFILILVFGSLQAQNPKKGFKLIENRKYLQAKSFFKDLSQKPKYFIIANYGLAKIYSASDFKNKNYDLAFRYVNKALRLYYRSGEKHKKFLLKYNINEDSLLNLKDFIATKAMQEVLATKSTAKMSKFIDLYADTKQAKYVERVRDSLTFEFVKKVNLPELYLDFVKNYPNSYLVDTAKKMYEKVLNEYYRQVFRSLEYEDIKKFKQKYPDYSYPDSAKIYEQLALEAKNLMLFKPFNPKDAPKFREFIKKAAPSEMAFVALQNLISPYVEKKDWDSALIVVKEFENYFKNNKKYENLKKLLAEDEKKLTVKSFSPNINSPLTQEYSPVLTADNSTLYFCSQDRPDQKGGEDIYVSYKKNGVWQKPIPVKELNTTFSEAPMSLTADGNKMLIFHNGDIYITEKTPKGWSTKKPIEQINTEYWENDAFITADGNAIIFSSDRPGNIGRFHKFNRLYHGDYIGNTDLYVIVKTENGWSEPINLGPVINTPYAERTPYLHPDMKTLYFSSDGHGGLGKTDVFKATRLSDTSWTLWSEPVNLGKEINTNRKEYGYKLTSDGDSAYFAKNTNNEADIFILNLSQEDKPEAIALISGFVLNKKDSTPLYAKVIWEDLESGDTLGILTSDPKTGKYSITLPLGKNYGFFVSKNGYYPISDNIDLREKTQNIFLKHNFYLTSIQDLINSEQPILLKNVFFDFDKYELKKESYPELDRLAKFLKNNPNIKIEISGHTDNIGSAEYNKKLSENRANAVKNYLISKGCNPNQLITVGYGAEKPIADNSTEQGRQINRRVEFKIIKK